MTATLMRPTASPTDLGGLADVLARAGTGAVLLAGSTDPNAKATIVLVDRFGPAFVVKVPTTAAAAEAVRHEGRLLAALHAGGLAGSAATVPRPLGYLDVDGRAALVTTALPGTPMTVRYHAWRHTARPRRVRADFAAAGRWLADLQARTAGVSAPVTMLHEAIVGVGARFAGHPGLPLLRRRLTPAAERLAGYATPRTVVHGDYWHGNLLLTSDRVTGVVDWEAGSPYGEPLRDVARFAVGYALYLDRHTRPGRRVRGHRFVTGASLDYVARGRGWFPALVRDHLAAALERLGLPGDLWRDVFLAGVADVAVGADHPGFARLHLAALLRMTAGRP